MTTTDLQDALIALFESVEDARDEMEGDDDNITLADIARDIAGDFEGIAKATSFDDAALLTRNEGVVLRTADGAEFQITIVQSRPGQGGQDD